MPGKKGASGPKKEVSPLVAEFQGCCKASGLQDEETINQVNAFLSRSETIIRLVHVHLTPPLCKALLRLFQRYQRLQHIILYACPITDDAAFVKQLVNEFNKCAANAISLDYMAIQRETLIPLLSTPSLDVLCLRGNQCITPYDFVSHEKGRFPASLNAFFNALTTSPIKVLNLYGCHLGDDGAIALANTLFFNTNLLCISLAKNRIGDAGATALASALGQYLLNEQETAIVEKFVNDESKNKISDEGGSLVRRKKGQKPPPKRSSSRPSKKSAHSKHPVERLPSFDPSAPVMPAVLTKWSASVTLENGQRALPGNSVVTTLILDENCIAEIGLKAIRAMLLQNTKLVQFSIDNNPEIPHDVAEALARKVPTPTAETP
jgi:hypothetical protein